MLHVRICAGGVGSTGVPTATKVPGPLTMALTYARKSLILRSTDYEIGPFRASKYPFSATS